ncbi:hypothetical protein HY57_12885 [Dyella japonica A8]|uniref:Uncharacterized protein n=1 Tax=Dyella japonica A8 TaxID=1217721 RepID=A0A075K7K2_9GAMM|nr:hypothetical protein HY57_12885 [Dyella japonica A8]
MVAPQRSDRLNEVVRHEAFGDDFRDLPHAAVIQSEEVAEVFLSQLVGFRHLAWLGKTMLRAYLRRPPVPVTPPDLVGCAYDVSGICDRRDWFM